MAPLSRSGWAAGGRAGEGSGEGVPRIVETACAGQFLLLRAALDARLPGLVERTGWPPGLDEEDGSGAPLRLRAVLSALGLAWAGEAALAGGRLDPGLAFLAGWPDLPPPLERLQALWQPATTEDHDRFQAALLATLAGHRLLGSGPLLLHRIPVPGGEALVGGPETGLWPLGRLLDSGDREDEVVSGWLTLWETATGTRPEALFSPLPEDLNRTLAGLALAAPLSANGAADLTITLAAAALLRLWGRWLRGFAESSAPYLADQFVRRPGRLRIERDAVLVLLEPRPLDMVLEMAGYAAELDRVSWLGDRRVRFRFGGRP